jgi:hypothetical protein
MRGPDDYARSAGRRSSCVVEACDRTSRRALSGVPCGKSRLARAICTRRPRPAADGASPRRPRVAPRTPLPGGGQERREERGKKAGVRWMPRSLGEDTAEAEASHRPSGTTPSAHTGRCREPLCGSAKRLPDQRQQNALETCARSMWRLRVKSTRGVMERELSRRPPRRSISSGQVSHCGNVELHLRRTEPRTVPCDGQAPDPTRRRNPAVRSPCSPARANSSATTVPPA